MFLMLFGVLHSFVEVGCILLVSLQLFALCDTKFFALKLSVLLRLILEWSELHRQHVGIAPH